jgi:hypothetical protein
MPSKRKQRLRSSRIDVSLHSFEDFNDETGRFLRSRLGAARRCGRSGSCRGLLGSTLGWQYFAYGGPYTGLNTFVDTGGVAGNFLGYFNIVADDTSFTFDYSTYPGSTSWSPSALSLAPTIHNGIAIDVISGPTITSVSIDPATNMVGFDPSRISFTGAQIQVDWQNLPFSSSTIVKLDINGSSVPEPASLTLLGLGAIVLIGYAGRQRLKRARAA